MNGLELARYYYDTVGHPALANHFPDLLPRMAIGLAGEGSECLGFDDEISRDHDWGAAFCIWLTADDYRCFGAAVQEIYDQLGVAEGIPVRKNVFGKERVGCLCIPQWFLHYTGFEEGPKTIEEWQRVPEAFLNTATNGAIFDDQLGVFSRIRSRLLGFYPEDVRIKKVAARAAVMAQSGQYNYPRCIRRGDTVAAQLALAEFSRAALSMVYLLNKRYAPFYKWMHRGLRQLPKLPRVGEQLVQLSTAHGETAQELVEGICINIVAELRRQGLTSRTDTFLQAHCLEMMEHIQDPALRRTHIMEE